MTTFKVFTARKQYSEHNEFIADIEAGSLDECKDKIRREHGLNPYYTLIKDEAGKIVYDQFCGFQEKVN